MKDAIALLWYAWVLLGYFLFTVLVWPFVLVAWIIVCGKCKPRATTDKQWLKDNA